MRAELDLKRKLVVVTDAVRKKFKQIKTESVKDKFELEKFYEPITTTLASISDGVKQQQQKQSRSSNLQTKTRIQSVSSTSAGHPSETSNIHVPETFEEFTSIADRTPAIDVSSRKDQMFESPQYSSVRSATLSSQSSGGKSRTNLDILLSGMKKRTPPLYDIANDASRNERLFETPSPSVSSSSTLSDQCISGEKSMKYLDSLLSGLKTKPSLFDTVYGVHYGNKSGKIKNKTYIGNMEVQFPSGNVSLHNNLTGNISVFDGSDQLYDLLFLKLPPIVDRVDDVSPSVYQKYKQILKLTNAAYKDYDEKNGLQDTRWKKYLNIIRPLILETKLGEGIRKKNKRSTIPLQKVLLSSRTPQYVYWNKPRELVNRLRLLWSSKMAGHTGHDNEIMSIIEELREEGIIY